MILIIGGAYQGKTDFALKNFGLEKNEITEGSWSFSELIRAKCIRHFENFVSAAIEKNESPEKLTLNLLNENPDAVIIMTETGGGIVPVEKSERIYREKAGKTGCLLAERAEKVIRVTCGIPVIIKGTEI